MVEMPLLVLALVNSLLTLSTVLFLFPSSPPSLFVLLLSYTVLPSLLLLLLLLSLLLFLLLIFVVIIVDLFVTVELSSAALLSSPCTKFFC